MHCLVASTKGGSHKNKLERQPGGKEYIVNNLDESYTKIHVSYRGCVDSGCTVHFYGYKVLVTNKNPVLRGICVGQPDATKMWS